MMKNMDYNRILAENLILKADIMFLLQVLDSLDTEMLDEYVLCDIEDIRENWEDDEDFESEYE